MVLNFLATALVTCGVGKVPKAPGTFGSLLAGIIWWFYSSYIGEVAIIVTFFVGWLGTHYYEKWNNRHDPKEVVIDEVVGMWMTLYLAPPKLSILLLGFLLFRLFDIWKPFPIGWVDKKVPGAFGTMFDDVLAGAIAWASLFGAITVTEHYGILL